MEPGWREAWLREASAKERTSWLGSRVADRQLSSHCWSWSITFAISNTEYQRLLLYSLFVEFPLYAVLSRSELKVGRSWAGSYEVGGVYIWAPMSGAEWGGRNEGFFPLFRAGQSGFFSFTLLKRKLIFQNFKPVTIIFFFKLFR